MNSKRGLSLLFLSSVLVSCTVTADDAELSDCESICKEAETVNCGGEVCVKECNAERSGAPDRCTEKGDAYYKCARNTSSVSCSDGFLSFYGCSDLQAAFFQCVNSEPGEGGSGEGGSGAGSNMSSGGAGGSVSTASGGAGGASYVCESVDAQGGAQCPDADPDNCVCYGCEATTCSDMTDCLCDVCKGDNFCQTHCYDDGICNPYFENCDCADCVAIPECN